MGDFTQACGPFRDDFALRGGPQHRTEDLQKGPVRPSPPTGGEASNLHPRIDLEADVQTAARGDHAPMTLLDYLIDSALVLLVLIQLKERPLTTRTLVRPIVILAIAEATVKTHVNHLFSKIGARDRAQAVHYAYTHGLAG
jgi:hypothetical protein